MSDDIKISLCASAARPHSWARFYDSLSRNNIKLEVIFVGPSEPVYDLPKNFKFIKSYVKPAQCYEIAFRQAQGELLHWTADDATYPEYSFDAMYDFWKSCNDEKVCTAFNTIEDNINNTFQHRFFSVEPSTPITAPFGVMSTKIFRELGGYDKKFVCGQAENDVTMRLYAIGGRIAYAPNLYVYVHHQEYHTQETVFRQGFNWADRLALENAWIRDGQLASVRLTPFEPFDDKDILTKTQGEKGKWL